jgi:protease-4
MTDGFEPTEPAAPQPQPEPAAAERRAAPPTPPSKRGRGIFWGLLGGCLVLFVLLTALGAAMAAVGKTSGEWWKIGPKVAVVPIEGEIFEARETVERLRGYAEDQAVRAIVVRINSPGGAVAPSQEIFAEIRRLRSETEKPIVASLDSVAASGGYYIAAACEPIVSNPGTITGSIGVILQWFNMEELVRWAKLEPQTITAGAMKDAGSPFRDLSDDERAYIQRITDQLHGQFIRAVTEGRKGKLTQGEVEKLADGRVFTGEEALQLKLVDRIGTLQDAIELAAERGGIRGEPRVIYPRRERPGLLDVLAGETSIKGVVQEVIGKPIGETRFLYRWY